MKWNISVKSLKLMVRIWSDLIISRLNLKKKKKKTNKQTKKVHNKEQCHNS